MSRTSAHGKFIEDQYTVGNPRLPERSVLLSESADPRRKQTLEGWGGRSWAVTIYSSTDVSKVEVSDSGALIWKYYRCLIMTRNHDWWTPPSINMYFFSFSATCLSITFPSSAPSPLLPTAPNTKHVRAPTPRRCPHAMPGQVNIINKPRSNLAAFPTLINRAIASQIGCW